MSPFLSYMCPNMAISAVYLYVQYFSSVSSFGSSFSVSSLWILFVYMSVLSSSTSTSVIFSPSANPYIMFVSYSFPYVVRLILFSSVISSFPATFSWLIVHHIPSFVSFFAPFLCFSNYIIWFLFVFSLFN